MIIKKNLKYKNLKINAKKFITGYNEEPLNILFTLLKLNRKYKQESFILMKTAFINFKIIWYLNYFYYKKERIICFKKISFLLN